MRIFYSGAIYITYALSCYVCYEIVWINGLKEKYNNSNHQVRWEYVVRTSIAVVTCKFQKLKILNNRGLDVLNSIHPFYFSYNGSCNTELGIIHLARWRFLFIGHGDCLPSNSTNIGILEQSTGDIWFCFDGFQKYYHYYDRHSSIHCWYFINAD